MVRDRAGALLVSQLGAQAQQAIGHDRRRLALVEPADVNHDEERPPIAGPRRPSRGS